MSGRVVVERREDLAKDDLRMMIRLVITITVTVLHVILTSS